MGGQEIDKEIRRWDIETVPGASCEEEFTVTWNKENRKWDRTMIPPQTLEEDRELHEDVEDEGVWDWSEEARRSHTLE